MEFGVLGSVEARTRGSLAPKLRSLLAILLCHANARVSSEQVIEALWADPPESARANVRIYVSQLRRTLSEEKRIVSRRGGYQLVLRRGELDALRFEDLVSQGRTAREAGDLVAAVDLLKQALALWRAPPSPMSSTG